MHARPGEDHHRLVVAADRLVDDPPRVLAQPGGLQAGAARLGVRVRVARQHLVADEVLDEGQRPARRGVVGVGDPAFAVRRAHHVVLADHRVPDQPHQGRLMTLFLLLRRLRALSPHVRAAAAGFGGGLTPAPAMKPQVRGSPSLCRCTRPSLLRVPVNEFGQPVGDPVDWTPGPDLVPVTLTGRTCRLEPLGEQHVDGLYAALCVDSPPSIWTYMPAVRSPTAPLRRLRRAAARDARRRSRSRSCCPTARRSGSPRSCASTTPTGPPRSATSPTPRRCSAPPPRPRRCT